MRAYVGTPAGPALRTVPEARPAPGEALVRVEAFSVNRGELGLFARRPEGWRPGQDIAGRVLAAADGGGPPAGTRVAAMVDFGGWAERVPVPVDRLAPLPDALRVEEAATFGVAGLTALRALRRGGQLLGARVLVTGASGGVGTFAVQLAAAGGAEVSALTGTHRSVDLAALGAHRVVTMLDAPTASSTSCWNRSGARCCSRPCGGSRRAGTSSYSALPRVSRRRSRSRRFGRTCARPSTPSGFTAPASPSAKASPSLPA